MRNLHHDFIFLPRQTVRVRKAKEEEGAHRDRIQDTRAFTKLLGWQAS